jgi:hypothetical protein
MHDKENALLSVLSLVRSVDCKPISSGSSWASAICVNLGDVSDSDVRLSSQPSRCSVCSWSEDFLVHLARSIHVTLPWRVARFS